MAKELKRSVLYFDGYPYGSISSDLHAEAAAAEHFPSCYKEHMNAELLLARTLYTPLRSHFYGCRGDC